MRVWDVVARVERCQLRGHSRPVQVLGFLKDSGTLISASGDRSADGEVRLWDTATSKEQGVLRVPLQPARSTAPLAISADGRTLAIEGLREARRPSAGGTVVSTEYGIRLWDMETLQERLALSGQSDVIWSAAFSPDGKSVAAALKGGRLIVWDTMTGKELQRCAGHPEGTRPDGGHTLAFSQDGKVVAAVGSSAALSLWDVTTGLETLASVDAHHSDVSVVSFAPDGATVATASSDHTIRLWESATSRHRLRLSGHKDAVRDLVFSSDGRMLASSSRDGAIKLWDVVEGKEVRTIQAVARTAGVYSGICPIAFTSDGKGLVSWGDDRRSGCGR